jgi:integrase
MPSDLTPEDIKNLPAGSRFTADTIKALEVPQTGSKFIGFSGGTYKERNQTYPLPTGLGVVVTANGVRTYVLNYVIAGRERRMKIAKCHEMSTASAIAKAKGLREQIAKGIDPMAERDAERKPKAKDKTVAALWHDWLSRRSGKAVSQVSAFKRHILPAIGDMPFKELGKAQIADMHDGVRKAGGDVIADRCLAYLGAVLHWQEQREDSWRAPSFAGLKCTNDKDRERERVLSDAEIRALWPVWEQAGAEGQLCRLLLLTGQRRSEIADLTWREVDLEAATATIPKERYKTRRSHSFPLSPPTMAILEGIEKRRDDRVFPPWSYGRIKSNLDAKLKLDPDWTFHDLRRTAASIMYANGVSIDDCDRVLGHTVKGVARVYVRDPVRGNFMEQQRKAVDTLARAIERILNPEPAKVVPLRA